MPEASSGFDRIEFRKPDAEYGYLFGDGSVPSVEVVINGIELTEVWKQAGGDGTLPLAIEDAGADLAVWGPYPSAPRWPKCQVGSYPS